MDIPLHQGRHCERSDAIQSGNHRRWRQDALDCRVAFGSSQWRRL